MNFIKLLLYTSIISFLISCKEKPLDKTSGTFKAICYNVAGLPEALSSSSPVKYTSLISPLLNDFDIVHVQEDFCYHDSLMLYNKHTSVSPPGQCVPYGDGLNTMTYFKIKEMRKKAWTNCSGFDCFTPKSFSYSKIELKPGVFIDFYNLHCNAGGSEESKKARRGNIKQFINYMNNKSPNEAIIIMGDFNSRYSRIGDTIRAFLDLGFKDSWLELIRENDIPALGTNSLKDCFPINTSIHCEGVDKVFFRGNDEFKIEVLNHQYGDDDRFLYNSIDTLPLSDHPPLMVTFSYEFKRKN